MASARQKAIQEKRRKGVRPYCRKRTLRPRAIRKAEQAVDAGAGELNPNFSHPLPLAIPHLRKRGAPAGNTNRLLHGKYTKQGQAFRADVRAHIYDARMLIVATRKLLRGDPEGIAWFGDIRGDPANAE